MLAGQLIAGARDGAVLVDAAPAKRGPPWELRRPARPPAHAPIASARDALSRQAPGASLSRAEQALEA